MAEHTQPTAEQLKEDLNKTLTEIDKTDDQSTTTDETIEPTKESTEEVKDKDDETTDKETVDEDVDGVPAKEEVTTEQATEEEEKKEPPTTEERYKESTKEAQRLYRNNVKMNQAIDDANSLPEPSDDDLKNENPEWDEMSDVEKRFARETFINKRFREHINQVSAEQRNVDQWVDKVSKYVEDPQTLIDHPELEGKAEKFKQFADDKKLVGTDFTILTAAFLHEQSKLRVKHTGKMLETGKGGDKKPAKPANDKLSVEEGRKLMQTDYRKYQQLLVQGKITMNVE